MNPVLNSEPRIDEAESSGMYNKEVLFDKKAYQKILSKSLKMDSHEGFKKGFLNFFKRTNIQYFGTHIMEQSIPGHLATGQVELPLITLDQVKRTLARIPASERSKIGYIHLGAVRIHIQASFQKGLDTPITLTVMHNRIRNRAEALLGILRGNLKYQKIGFTVYPGFGLPISDLDTCRAINLGYDFPRADLFESLSHAPFTIYTMVSYMLSNTHIIDRFLDKDDIEIDDIFSDVCEVQPVAPHTLPRVEPNQELDIRIKPILDRTISMPHRYSIDGSTLRFIPPKKAPSPNTANYQFVTKLFITSWSDRLIWINPSLQHNYIGPDLFAQIQEHKAQYVSILIGSAEQIVHIESSPLPSKADLILGLRFLTSVTYTKTDRVLTIKHNGNIIQAVRTYD